MLVAMATTILDAILSPGAAFKILCLCLTCSPVKGKSQINHSTGLCSATWPLNGTKPAGGPALIQTCLLLSCKCP